MKEIAFEHGIDMWGPLITRLVSKVPSQFPCGNCKS